MLRLHAAPVAILAAAAARLSLHAAVAAMPAAMPAIIAMQELLSAAPLHSLGLQQDPAVVGSAVVEGTAAALAPWHGTIGHMERCVICVNAITFLPYKVAYENKT